MSIQSKSAVVLTAFLMVVNVSGNAHAWTVPNKADDKGNRIIKCEDGTTFTHHGTYDQAMASADLSCKTHGGKWVIEDAGVQLSAQSAQPIGAALLDGADPLASGQAPASTQKEAVRPGVGRGK